MDDTEKLIRRLSELPNETEYVEFKTNFDKINVGRRISAIANSLPLLNRDFGYIVFGIEDKTHKLIGTDFYPDLEKTGNTPIKNWFTQKISPQLDIEYLECDFNTLHYVVIKIPAAIDRPILFDDTPFIRIGETTKELREFPDKERKIWNNQRNRNYEKNFAAENVSESEVLKLLEFDKYFQLTKQDLPTVTNQFLSKLGEDRLVIPQDEGNFRITILGGILFAKDLNQFPIIQRKKTRTIVYNGNTKSDRRNDREGDKGYAIEFAELIEYINSQLPQNEHISETLRIRRRVYPEIALREFVANALIHQDLSIKGAGPLIEIFDNRIEITNPGKPLIDVDRFIDHAPISRNENLAGLMRRFGYCEESGSGVDRALAQIELYQLPAPKFETYDDFTKITLFAPKTLKQMTDEDKIRACYQHCVLVYISSGGTQKMNNTSLRKRLNIGDKNYPTASKIIQLTLRQGYIKEAGKPKEYIPSWA